MKPIILASEELHRTRRQAVRQLVAPLLPQRSNSIVERIGINRDAFTLSVIPHGRQPSSFLNPEEPLVGTRLPKLLLNYHEVWKLQNPGDEYNLDRVYMHLHLASPSKAQQIFSLHCDPSMKQSEAHFRYRRGPHIHIDGATPNIGRAHVSLCLMDKDLGGTDLSTLMAGFREAVKMIISEFFPCWERGSPS